MICTFKCVAVFHSVVPCVCTPMLSHCQTLQHRMICTFKCAAVLYTFKFVAAVFLCCSVLQCDAVLLCPYQCYHTVQHCNNTATRNDLHNQVCCSVSQRDAFRMCPYQCVYLCVWWSFYRCVCVCVCARARAGVCVCACVRARVCARVRVCVCTCVCLRVSVCVRRRARVLGLSADNQGR